ncbi:raffinose/stachyose/melibiose transport system permease protein [Thermocatellispora tengchongensis]|uniref:Raffinose/stachyose/melibiose transport system permease protein n=1 Tax=Thermocatellispora tengchongensis TaxID=1073253 RepID=A0A840PNF1_9ACTN|nr:sugar ABC transporter permease [Thermocatellispora tengchongensis]MBB5139563.1 raffinose/stachyose/melibiose transport system permease protein [Thermocatellispora tengchongensis]
MADTYEATAAPPATGTSTEAAPRARARRSRGRAPWWFMIPALILYAYVVLIPSVRGAGYAFTDWSGLGDAMSFVGLENFRKILDDSAATDALVQTVLITLAITIVQNLIGLLLALGVHTQIKSRNFLRVLLFAPAVMTPVVTAYLWRYMYAPDGAINGLFEAVGLGGLAQNWLGDPDIALWSVAAIVIWQFAGYSMVIFLAGLQGVPRELHEAAGVDGAGAFQRFWHITRPMLAPAITINLMLSLIGGFKIFDQVYVTTGGGPGHSTETLSTLIYKNAFQFDEYAYSTAIAVVLAVIVAAVSAVQYRGLQQQKGAA